MKSSKWFQIFVAGGAIMLALSAAAKAHAPISVRLTRPAVPEATARAATMPMLLVRRKNFNGRSLFGARTVDLKKLEAPTKPDKT